MNARSPEALDCQEQCVAEATLAPSIHNSQPWRFRIAGSRIELIADRSRRLPLSDPDDRQLTISCGAALLNLRVAAAARGYGAMVELLPQATDADLLARVTLSAELRPDIEDAGRLARAILDRRTCRRKFDSLSTHPGLIPELRHAVSQEGARLVIFDTAEMRAAASELIQEADALLWADRNWRMELSRWMDPARQGEGFRIPGLSQLAAELVTRSFDLGTGVAARDAELLDGSPLLLLLGTARDTPLDWLQCGQAMQSLLLHACSHGVQASFLNQPMYVDRIRAALRARFAQAGWPQVLLRLGRAQTPVVATPRRSVASVLAIDWLAT